MLKLTDSVCIDAPATQVWHWLTRLEDITLWAEPVVRANCSAQKASGVGAERTCWLKGSIAIVERWTDWKEGVSFTYEGTGMPFVKFARNTWSIHAEGENRTLLVTEAQVELKGGIAGRCLEPLMAVAARRMGRSSLAAFKYLVENGRPYTGKHAGLPRAPAFC